MNLGFVYQPARYKQRFKVRCSNGKVYSDTQNFNETETHLIIRTGMKGIAEVFRDTDTLYRFTPNW